MSDIKQMKKFLEYALNTLEAADGRGDGTMPVDDFAADEIRQAANSGDADRMREAVAEASSHACHLVGWADAEITLLNRDMNKLEALISRAGDTLKEVA